MLASIGPPLFAFATGEQGRIGGPSYASVKSAANGSLLRHFARVDRAIAVLVAARGCLVVTSSSSPRPLAPATEVRHSSRGEPEVTAAERRQGSVTSASLSSSSMNG